MRLFLERCGRLPAVPAGPLVAAGVWVFLMAGLMVIQEAFSFRMDLCLFHRFTGIPCPFCRSGRAVLLLFHFQVVESFCANPFMMTAIAFVFVVFLARLATGWAPRLTMSKAENIWVKAGVTALFLANWGYLIFSNQVA
jgi:hypothetical protein